MENIKHINMYMKVKATRTVASFVSHCSVQQYGEKLYTHFFFFFVVVKGVWCKNGVLARIYSTKV